MAGIQVAESDSLRIDFIVDVSIGFPSPPTRGITCRRRRAKSGTCNFVLRQAIGEYKRQAIVGGVSASKYEVDRLGEVIGKGMHKIKAFLRLCCTHSATNVRSKGR
jgi:hypothetical protein